MKLIKYMGFCMLLGACEDQQGSKLHVDIKEVVGCWELITPANSINYPMICFEKDSTAIFSSRGDTVYSFSVRTMGGALGLNDGLGKEFEFPVLYVSKDSLVLKDGMGDGEVLEYRRN